MRFKDKSIRYFALWILHSVQLLQRENIPVNKDRDAQKFWYRETTEKNIRSHTWELEIYSLTMYQSCALVSISCKFKHMKNMFHWLKQEGIQNLVINTHTKNWKPLSVNLGASLSLQIRHINNMIPKSRTRILNCLQQETDDYKCERKYYLWIKRPRWKTFIVEELKFIGLSAWAELIRCSKKHWINKIGRFKIIA